MRSFSVLCSFDKVYRIFTKVECCVVLVECWFPGQRFIFALYDGVTNYPGLVGHISIFMSTVVFVKLFYSILSLLNEYRDSNVLISGETLTFVKVVFGVIEVLHGSSYISHHVCCLMGTNCVIGLQTET